MSNEAGDVLKGPRRASSSTLRLMQVTSQCHVDAPLEWVRSFLLAGTREDDVTVDGDVIEVRQRDRLIDLVVRNHLRSDADGGTVLDVDANLRLLGLARIVGGLFRARVRRTLERGLDRLPTAMAQALEGEQDEDEAREDETVRHVEEGAGG